MSEETQLPPFILSKLRSILPGDDPLTASEAEQRLNKHLRELEMQHYDTVWGLIQLYQYTGRQPEALVLIREIIKRVNNPEMTAHLLLAQGQLMEQMNNFEAAVQIYSEAFAMEPTTTAI